MAGLVLFFQLCVLLYIQPGYNSLPEKVVVGFYGEALCPDCINFGNGPLTEAFKEVRASMTWIIIIPICPLDFGDFHP